MTSSFLATVRVAAMTMTTALCATGISRADDGPRQSQHDGVLHTVISPTSLTWTPLNSEMSIAHLSGSPDVQGAPFVIRFKLKDGTRVPPHWHPIDEHLTVVSGSFHMGMGERFDESVATAMSAGAYCLMLKDVRHFGWVTGETVIQIHGIGPFTTFFVDK